MKIIKTIILLSLFTTTLLSSIAKTGNINGTVVDTSGSGDKTAIMKLSQTVSMAPQNGTGTDTNNLAVSWQKRLIPWTDSLIAPASAKYYSVDTISLPNGKVLNKVGIIGPPVPPPGYEIERRSVSLPEPDSAAAINTLTVPAFKWVFGCSAVSGAMIAGYYDRSGFTNMYTGPTNGGLMPLDNSSWPTWSDGYKTYPNCPLIASKNGIDGRATRGSIDDYWVEYGS